MKIIKPINILLYEDNPGYRDSFKLAAQKQRIITDAYDNVDNLLEALEDDPRKHKFVVLDARAYLHEGQAHGTESEANLHKIFREIDRIGKMQDRIIPFCINTGFAEIKLQYQEVVQCRIFEKGQENELFQFIWESYKNTDAAILRMNYPDVFEFADAYFENADMEILSSLLLNQRYESNKISDKINNLSNLRRLIEHTMDIIFDRHLAKQSGIVRKNSTRASDIINHLNGHGVVPTHVFGTIVNILKTASNFGSHTPEQATLISDYPSNNLIKGLTYGYFDVIDWAKKLLS
jgi:hypothetical protein